MDSIASIFTRVTLRMVTAFNLRSAAAISSGVSSSSACFCFFAVASTIFLPRMTFFSGLFNVPVSNPSLRMMILKSYLSTPAMASRT